MCKFAAKNIFIYNKLIFLAFVPLATLDLLYLVKFV